VSTVLYVDDEEAIRRAVGAWLARKGHTVHTAADITAARDVLSKNDIDGVFIDVWLGSESGFELKAWLDEHQPATARNVVFVTGDIITNPQVQQTFKALGNPVLPKPFDLQELEKHVEGWR
jgi:DNA-binding NtrC family response regulator